MIATRKALKMQPVITNNKAILPLTNQRVLSLAFVLYPISKQFHKKSKMRCVVATLQVVRP